MISLDPKKHTNPLKFFVSVNKKEIPLIIARTVCYGLGTLGTVGMVFYVGKVIDGLQTDPVQLNRSLMLLIAAFIFHEIAYRIGHCFEIITQARIRAKSKKALFNHTSKLSFGYFTDSFAGQISHQINTVANALESMETIMINTFIDNTWMLLLSSVAIIGIYRPLGWVILVWAIIYIIGVRFFAKKITLHAENFAQQESGTTGVLVDMYTNISTVKVYSRHSQLPTAPVEYPHGTTHIQRQRASHGTLCTRS